jgi:hypothetical protein
MYWSIHTVNPEELAQRAAPEPGPPAGRFVLHRHRDAAGPHLDLRLEQDGFLLGWRIDGSSLSGGCWATEKPPHPLYWLEQDGEAVRMDEGAYTWVRRDAGERELMLHGRGGTTFLRVHRERGMRVSAVRELCATLNEHGLTSCQAAGLVADGVVARRRAIERFCGLGRELDGAAFDAAVWRKTLAPLSLQEIQSHLQGFEVRFDRKYPPQPVSRPEPLPEESVPANAARAMAILKS